MNKAMKWIARFSQTPSSGIMDAGRRSMRRRMRWKNVKRGTVESRKGEGQTPNNHDRKKRSRSWCPFVWRAGMRRGGRRYSFDLVCCGPYRFEVKDRGWRERLLESTRGRILQQLRAREETVNELAATLQLTDNAVRAHLLSLERDGLVQQTGIQPGFRRPHALYGLTSQSEQIFPKAYGALLDL